MIPRCFESPEPQNSRPELTVICLCLGARSPSRSRLWDKTPLNYTPPPSLRPGAAVRSRCSNYRSSFLSATALMCCPPNAPPNSTA
ncbi:hypothetical protein AOQ84DRAFT_355049 [Glonium stellatum]|uniref:Uncharacterized protein n=1 Tax=Glonium stellatum TaxID=574774 RepID=A0A8E2EZ05_9PEZI|nr:hypothetical protein AOQ84DRAFT_355049 [Glonium stellatum]